MAQKILIPEWQPVGAPTGFGGVFVRYKLRMQFLNRLCGGIPNKKELIQPWLDSRKPKAIPPGGKSITEIQEEVLKTIAEQEPIEFTSNVFQQVDGCLVVRTDNVRAHMKDCARVLSSKYIGKLEGEAAFSSRIIDCVYPEKHQYWTPILKADGTPFTKATGSIEKAVHIKDRAGSRSALKRFEYVEGAILEVILCVIAKPRQTKVKKAKDVEASVAKPAVSEVDLYTLFDYGGTHGFGPERGAGEGRYTFELFQEV